MISMVTTATPMMNVASQPSRLNRLRTFQWKGGLDSKLWEAREFYAIVALATIGGTVLNFTGIDPIKALFWSAVINGVIAVPIMVVMMLLAANPEVMGTFAVRSRLSWLGWLATFIMGVAVVTMLII
jgi:Mn2+/Fe2+ NRAMP family transporter